MEYPSDHFVTYTDTTVPQNESFPDLDFMLQSPITDSSGGPSYTHETSSLMYNQSVSNHSFGSPYASPEETTKGQKRRQNTANPENGYGFDENNERNLTELSNQSKKIQKRNKAKQRAKIKQNMAQVLATAPEKYIPSGIDDPNLDDKTKRKMIQMAKNRMAAQKTRDRKKQYTSELEEVKEHLNRVNDELAEKNRLLEERIKALEVSQMYLLQENQELKKSQFMEAFYQPNTAPSENTGFDSTSNEEYRSMPSPALVRGQSRSSNNYWNFFLGIIAICAIFTGINIKIGQETENLPDPFKDTIDEWEMETFYPPPSIAEVARKEEEPAVAETFSVRTKVSHEPESSTGLKTSKPKTARPQAMSTMSISVGDFEPPHGYGPATGEPQQMFAASLMMASDTAYQPTTPKKNKWDFLNELLTLRTGQSYPWDDPNYVPPPPRVYQPTTPKKNQWRFLNELITLRTGLCYQWDDPNYVDPYQMGAYVDLDLGETTTFLVNHEHDDDMAYMDVNINVDYSQGQNNNFGEINEKLAIQAV